jgi:hypothetical protein
MAFFLGHIISKSLPGLWGEDYVYDSDSLFSIDGKLPPVNYSSHKINSHSVTHVEEAYTLRKMVNLLISTLSIMKFFMVIVN